VAISREWHAIHKLGRKATLEERLSWHVKHAANCDCREMPPTIKRELKARGLLEPTQRSLK
jgi:hypothetical protein